MDKSTNSRGNSSCCTGQWKHRWQDSMHTWNSWILKSAWKELVLSVNCHVLSVATQMTVCITVFPIFLYYIWIKLIKLKSYTFNLKIITYSQDKAELSAFSPSSTRNRIKRRREGWNMGCVGCSLVGLALLCCLWVDVEYWGLEQIESTGSGVNSLESQLHPFPPMGIWEMM